MQRKCLKCGHTNGTSTGDALEACPQCGAIYSRVEAALAARAAGDPRAAMPRPAAASPASQPRAPARNNVDMRGFAETLRSESLYPTFRSLVKLFYWFWMVLAFCTFAGMLLMVFRGSGIERIGSTIGMVLLSMFFVLMARLTSEMSLMLADLSDAAVRLAANQSQE